MNRKQQAGSLEVAIGPHAGRPRWNVLRVSYDGQNPHHEARVTDALQVLLSPRESAAGVDSGAESPAGSR